MMNRNLTARFRCDGLGKSYDLTHYDLIRQEGPARFAVSGFSKLGLRLELEIENRGDDGAAIALPWRYTHSANEVVDLRDLQGLIDVVEEAIRVLGRGFSLRRI